MKISEIRRETREALKGKWRKCIAVVVIYIAIILGFRLIGGFFQNEYIKTTLNVIETMISIQLGYGLAYTFVKLKKGEKVKAFKFIDVASRESLKLWEIVARTALKLILPIILLIISLVILVYVEIYSLSAMQLDASANLWWLIGVGIVVFILSIIYFIVKALLYSLTSVIAHDKTEMKAKEVVNESKRLMKKNRWKLIWIELPYIIWEIFGLVIMADGVKYWEILIYTLGYIYFYSFTQMAIVCFYEKLLYNSTEK